MDTKPIPESLKYWSDHQPMSEAFVYVSKDHSKVVLTSKQIYKLSLTFANHLFKIGVKPGSVVFSLIPGSPAAMVAFFGTLCAGCTAMNPTIQMSDGRYLLQNLNKTKCQAVIIPSDPESQAHQILTKYFDTVCGNHVTSARLPHLKNVIFTEYTVGTDLGFIWEEGVESSGNSFDEPVPITGDAPAMITFTSGSTGLPKLIIYSHEFLSHMFDPFCSVSNLLRPVYPNICLFDPFPLTWSVGLPFWYWITGDRTIMLDYRFQKKDCLDIELIKEIIMEEGCNLAKFPSPTCLELTTLLKSGSFDLNKWPLRTVFTAGQPLKHSINKVIGTLTHAVYNIYGSSECGIVSMKKIDRDCPFEDFNTGSAVKDTKIRIVDNNFTPVPQGTFGHILLKVPNKFSGYVDDEDDQMKKACYTEDGWFKTNDYGCLTENNELIVHGRFNDVIMRGMKKYHPTWIEKVIRECPGVADVLVVKVPDDVLFSEICACFVPEENSNTNESTVKEFCLEKFNSQVPNEITACPKYFLRIESLPVNKNGKYDRKVLEEKAAKLLNLF